MASEKTWHRTTYPGPIFSEAVIESVLVFSLARPPPASKDKPQHLVCTADCWAGHRLSAAPHQEAARHWGRRKGQERLPPTRPTQATTCSKRKKENFTADEESVLLHKDSDLPSPHRLSPRTPLGSHQFAMLLAIQELFCAEGVVISSSFFVNATFPSTCPLHAFTLHDDFLHFPQPQENRCELVVFSFVFR